MRLMDLIDGVSLTDVFGDATVEVQSPQFDSRKVGSGDVFVAVSGTQVDGHNFVPQVIKNGARAVICEIPPQERPAEVTFVVVPNSSVALGIIAQNFYGRPSLKLKVVGITGTNGKTTTATSLYSLFSNLGRTCGLLSTIRNVVGEKTIPATHTTGDALQIGALMAQMVEHGCSHCFMEVTSHAIDQQRIAGVLFSGAAFTNLTHDHLDYHKTFEAYRDTKRRFFDSLAPDAFALTNSDDANGAYMTSNTNARRYTYGKYGEDFRLEITRLTSEGSSIRINGKPIEMQLIGAFNAYNACAVFGTASLLGIGAEDLVASLPKLKPVEGRMQKIVSVGGVVGVVDFAHTPDALEKALVTLRDFVGAGRIITVVGCGGDRDREKRPIMGAIAARESDRVFLTSDNPRSEDPARIIDEMYNGITAVDRPKVQRIVDRLSAIHAACGEAQSSDVVLVAGKGHEKYQEIAGVRNPFDDTTTLIEALRPVVNVGDT